MTARSRKLRAHILTGMNQEWSQSLLPRLSRLNFPKWCHQLWTNVQMPKTEGTSQSIRHGACAYWSVCLSVLLSKNYLVLKSLEATENNPCCKLAISGLDWSLTFICLTYKWALKKKPPWMKPRIQEAAQKSQWALHVSLICRGGYIKTAEGTGCAIRDSDTEGLPKHHRHFRREGPSCWLAFRYQTLGIPKINILNLFQYYDF